MVTQCVTSQMSIYLSFEKVQAVPAQFRVFQKGAAVRHPLVFSKATAVRLELS